VAFVVVWRHAEKGPHDLWPRSAVSGWSTPSPMLWWSEMVRRASLMTSAIKVLGAGLSCADLLLRHRSWPAVEAGETVGSAAREVALLSWPDVEARREGEWSSIVFCFHGAGINLEVEEGFGLDRVLLPASCPLYKVLGLCCNFLSFWVSL
jgi:hypothetical protein